MEERIVLPALSTQQIDNQDTKLLNDLRRFCAFDRFRDASIAPGTKTAEEHSSDELVLPVPRHGNRPQFSSFGRASHMWGGEHQYHQLVDLAAAAKDFAKDVEEIEEALSGGSAVLKPLRRGELLEDRVKPHALKHYKVSLPSRPSTVTVLIKPASGSAETPALWGSTNYDRPDSLNSEIKGGQTGKLIYEHSLPPPKSIEEYVEVDRRYAVPNFSELYLTVEGHGSSECTFWISFSIKPLAVVLSRFELRAQLETRRKTWRVRVAELRKSENLREQFDADVKSHQKAVQEGKKVEWGDSDFVERNRKVVAEASPQHKCYTRERLALQRIARQDAAKLRRERLAESDIDCQAEASSEYVSATDDEPGPPAPKWPSSSPHHSQSSNSERPQISTMAAMNRAVFPGVRNRKLKKIQTKEVGSEQKNRATRPTK